MNAADQRPVSLLICALGGEGGGVLAEWLVETAIRSGYAAQSTSIPGVAQRTGSTTYYFEVFPVPMAELGGRNPVFSLYPVAGALDVLVSSELLETTRQVGNGMASPDRTLVVTSSARTLTTAEKLALADGRADSGKLLEVVGQHSRDLRVFDMSAIARETGTVLSAVLFGAIAGSGALPFSRAAFEQTVRDSGRGAEASLRGFARGFDAIAGLGAEAVASETDPDFAGAVLPAALARAFPAQAHDMLAAGYARVLDYQDNYYAALYVQRMEKIREADLASDAGGDFATTRETARFLALWMAFDDVVRVAALKCRASRFERVRREVKAGEDELLRIYDHFKPGIPEFAGLLPSGLAGALVRWDRRRQSAGHKPLALPLKIGVHTVAGFAAMRVLASLKRLRRRGSRFALEQAMIERWLAAIAAGAREHPALGLEIALCGRLIKGYGATNDRGRENLLHVLDHLATGGRFADALSRANAIRDARLAALADDAGRELDRTLASHGAPPRPIKAQPIVWVKKARGNSA